MCNLIPELPWPSPANAGIKFADTSVQVVSNNHLATYAHNLLRKIEHTLTRVPLNNAVQHIINHWVAMPLCKTDGILNDHRNSHDIFY